MFKFLIKNCFLIYLVLPSFVVSQERKFLKAEDQYSRFRYMESRESYLEANKKGYINADLYKNLGNSYYFNSEFTEAQNWYKQLIDKFPKEVPAEYYFRYAQTLKALEDYKESDKYMKIFAQLSTKDQRAQLFNASEDYLSKIDFQSNRYKVENVSVNSFVSDFGTAFYKDYIVFSSSRDTSVVRKRIHLWNNQPFLDLYQAKYDSENGMLSNVEKFDKRINTKLHESTPVFTKDGLTMYFTRNNFNKGKEAKDKEGTNRLKIYRSTKKENGDWTVAESLSFNSDEYSCAHPALSVDERTLYFSSDIPGGKGLSDLYSVEIKSDGTIGEPINLGEKINTEGQETFPFVSQNEDLYFASNGHMGLGGLDIFVTRLQPKNEQEAKIINVGRPINGPKDDFAFIINDTTKRGFFSSNRNQGKGKDDIYRFLQLEDLRNPCQINLVGVTTDVESSEILSGAVVSLYTSSNTLVSTFTTGDDGVYSFDSIDCDVDYFISANKEKYFGKERTITTPEVSETISIPLALEIKEKPFKVGDDLAEKLNLLPIYFDFNKSFIRPDAEICKNGVKCSDEEHQLNRRSEFIIVE